VGAENNTRQSKKRGYLLRGNLLTRSIKPLFAPSGVDRDHVNCLMHNYLPDWCRLLSPDGLPMLQTVTRLGVPLSTVKGLRKTR